MDDLTSGLVATRDQLAARYGDRVVFSDPHRGELTATVAAGDLLEVLAWLRDTPELGYRQLSDVTAVDRLPAEPRFEVVYHLLALATGSRLRLKIRVAEREAAPSVTGLWRGANYMEREVFDLFGIPFAGHPNLERILTPDDYSGHPLRRDFPLGSEPVAFDIPHRKRFSDAAI